MGIRDILKSKGIVVFTVEALGQSSTPSVSTSSSVSYALQPSGRIAHSQQYITKVIQEVNEELFYHESSPIFASQLINKMTITTNYVMNYCYSID